MTDREIVERIAEEGCCDTCSSKRDCIGTGCHIKAVAALREAQVDNAKLQALFDLQRTHMTEAIAAWQKSHAHQSDIIPDLGKLLEWLLFELSENENYIGKLAMERNTAEAEVARLREIVDADTDSCDIGRAILPIVDALPIKTETEAGNAAKIIDAALKLREVK